MDRQKNRKAWQAFLVSWAPAGVKNIIILLLYLSIRFIEDDFFYNASPVKWSAIKYL